MPSASVTVLPAIDTAVGVWTVPPSDTEKLPLEGTDPVSIALLKTTFRDDRYTDAPSRVSAAGRGTRRATEIWLMRPPFCGATPTNQVSKARPVSVWERLER